MKYLKVFPTGKAMCPDYEALKDGILRFVGRKHDPSIGKNGGWIPQEGVVTLPFCKEYLDEIKSGALTPADTETARVAGVLKVYK